MSFAPTKNGTARKAAEDPKKSTSVVQESPYNIQQRSRSNFDGDLTGRLDVLENHLSRISNQQDALLPLMNMLELAPNVAKNENLLKNLNKKSQDTEDKIFRMEQMMKGYQSNIESTLNKLAQAPRNPQFDAALFERNLKLVTTQVNEHSNTIKNLEGGFDSFQRAVDQRIEDENDVTKRAVDTKLQAQKNEFSVVIGDLTGKINDRLKQVDDALKNLYERSQSYEEYLQENSKPKVWKEIQDLVGTTFQTHLNVLRDKYDRDLDILYREFGIIRSELDIMNEEKRQQKMAPHIQSLPKDAFPAEKKIKVNNVEQALNIHELEKFNKDNTQRIMYELQAFDDKLDNLRNKFLNYKGRSKSGLTADLGDELNKIKEEMDIVQEKYISLKYQIEGAKQKYFFDMRKIEDKMEKLIQIKREAQDELSSNQKLKRIVPQEVQVIDTFPEKIKTLMESIQLNLQTTTDRLEIVEEKMKENQDLLTNKKK